MQNFTYIIDNILLTRFCADTLFVSLENIFLSLHWQPKNVFLLPVHAIPLWLKRASFDTKESLFFLKVGKVTFFVRKSLLCRYSALSLHSKTVGKWPISDSFSQSAFALPSLWVRSAFALGSLCLLFRKRRKEGDRRERRRKKLKTKKLKTTKLMDWVIWPRKPSPL